MKIGAAGVVGVAPNERREAGHPDASNLGSGSVEGAQHPGHSPDLL